MYLVHVDSTIRPPSPLVDLRGLFINPPSPPSGPHGLRMPLCSPNFIQVGKGRDWKTKTASQKNFIRHAAVTAVCLIMI